MNERRFSLSSLMNRQLYVLYILPESRLACRHAPIQRHHPLVPVRHLFFFSLVLRVSCQVAADQFCSPAPPPLSPLYENRSWYVCYCFHDYEIDNWSLHIEAFIV